MRYYCNCGSYFGKSMQLKEHISLCNIRWPRKDPTDIHWRVTEEDWRLWKAAQYRILLDTPEEAR